MTDDDVELSPPAPRPDRVRTTLLVVLAAAALLAAGAIGFLISDKSSSNSSGLTRPAAVDVGFAQDMAAHHQQAVTMAGYVRDNTTDRAVFTLAYDIETSQSLQMGDFRGWLDAWQEPLVDQSPMAWMDHPLEPGGLMTGMATPAEMSALQQMSGKALDIRFLQLMIRHHQGGVIMAKYALAHATLDYVRTAASSIVAAQSSEIITMEQMLRELGGRPLAPAQ